MGLLRAIGTRALGMSIVNLVVGAGTFTLPCEVAAQMGAGAGVVAAPIGGLRAEPE